MAAGLGVLRLPPAHFWAMTPRELSSALAGVAGLPGRRPPPARDSLGDLMRRFPDLGPARP